VCLRRAEVEFQFKLSNGAKDTILFIAFFFVVAWYKYLQKALETWCLSSADTELCFQETSSFGLCACLTPSQERYDSHPSDDSSFQL